MVDPFEDQRGTGTSASLIVNVHPGTAYVRLDEGAEYLAPCTFNGLAPGWHTLTLRAENYPSETQRLVVPSGPGVVFDVDLRGQTTNLTPLPPVDPGDSINPF